MDETQTDLKKAVIGTKEVVALTPKKVKIEKAQIETIGEGSKAFKKVVCSVKHPDKEELINVSSVQFIQKTNVKTSGLWVKMDDENKIQKGSALALLLTHLGCANIEALEGRDCDTIEDEKGFLCLKAY